MKIDKTTGLKVLFGGMSLFMVFLVIDTCMKSNMFQLPPEVTGEPWFTTTLVDFYFNIVILSAWVIYKETKGLMAALWIIAFILLGSIATCLYVFLQLKNNDSIEKVLLRKA